MSTTPLTLAQASERRLLSDANRGIHTWSNGSEWECWAAGNCLECWHWDADDLGGRCAFEGAAFIGMVSPELARMFGWIRSETDTQDGERFGWDSPQTCAFFRAKTDDDGGDNPPPPEPDPLQLVLIADPTEDVAAFATPPAEQRELAGVRV